MSAESPPKHKPCRGRSPSTRRHRAPSRRTFRRKFSTDTVQSKCWDTAPWTDAYNVAGAQAMPCSARRTAISVSKIIAWRCSGLRCANHAAAIRKSASTNAGGASSSAASAANWQGTFSSGWPAFPSINQACSIRSRLLRASAHTTTPNTVADAPASAADHSKGSSKESPWDLVSDAPLFANGIEHLQSSDSPKNSLSADIFPTRDPDCFPVDSKTRVSC